LLEILPQRSGKIKIQNPKPKFLTALAGSRPQIL